VAGELLSRLLKICSLELESKVVCTALFSCPGCLVGSLSPLLDEALAERRAACYFSAVPNTVYKKVQDKLLLLARKCQIYLKRAVVAVALASS